MLIFHFKRDLVVEISKRCFCFWPEQCTGMLSSGGQALCFCRAPAVLWIIITFLILFFFPLFWDILTSIWSEHYKIGSQICNALKLKKPSELRTDQIQYVYLNLSIFTKCFSHLKPIMAKFFTWHICLYCVKCKTIFCTHYTSKYHVPSFAVEHA